MHDLNNILEEVCINFSISAEDAKKLTLGEVDALLKQELLKEKAAVIKRNSEDAEYVKKVSTCFPHWEYFCNNWGIALKTMFSIKIVTISLIPIVLEAQK